MAINIQNLIHALEQKQNSVSSALDIMQIAKAIDLLRLNKVNFIESYSGLPDISSVPLGTLYYVESEECLYVLEYEYTTGKKWRSLVEVFGVIWTWGKNTLGPLGDGTTVDKCSPVSVVGGFTDWCQIASSIANIGLRSNGTLWAWGDNRKASIGDGTTVDKCSPVSVIGGFDDWCFVTSGTGQVHAIRKNGTMWSWGQNGNGRLGNNTNSGDFCSPSSVVGGFTDWCLVSAGDNHSLATRTNGTLWSWGNAASGALGNGGPPATDFSSPISVVGGFTDWCQVSAGANFSSAIRTNGTLWTWGKNQCGQLGDGTTVDKCSPVSVIGGFTDWCQVSLGDAQAAAVRQNGTLWTWGDARNGALGTNSIVSRSSPVSVVGGFTDWCFVTMGVRQATAVRTNGTLWSWGSNNTGELGDGTNVDKSSPVSVLPVNGILWSKVSSSPTQNQRMAITLKDKKF